MCRRAGWWVLPEWVLTEHPPRLHPAELRPSPPASPSPPLHQGFILYRVLMPMINEAFFCMMESVGSPEDIDRGMRLGTNMALGPLKLADSIGA